MIKKYKNGENVPYLEINKVVLIHCHVNNIHQQSCSLVTLKSI